MFSDPVVSLSAVENAGLSQGEKGCGLLSEPCWPDAVMQVSTCFMQVSTCFSRFGSTQWLYRLKYVLLCKYITDSTYTEEFLMIKHTFKWDKSVEVSYVLSCC